MRVPGVGASTQPTYRWQNQTALSSSAYVAPSGALQIAGLGLPEDPPAVSIPGLLTGGAYAIPLGPTLVPGLVTIVPPDQGMIQKALDQTGATGGGIVLVGPGIVNCQWNPDPSSGQYYGFMIPANTTLAGSGMYTTTFVFPITLPGTCVAFTPALNAAYWSLSSFGMNGGAADQDEVAQWVSRASDLANNPLHDIVWEGLYVTKFGAGINPGLQGHVAANNPYNITIRNCVFHNTNNVKISGGASYLSITGNSFIQDPGLLDQGGSIGIASNSTSQGITGITIANNLVNGGNDFTIQANTGVPISELVIIGNSLQTRFGLGVLVGGTIGGPVMSRVTITGNVIDSSNSTVADAQALTIRSNIQDVVVTGNLCITGPTTSFATITLQGPVTNLIINDNRVISQTSSIGMAAGQTLTNAVIVNNVIDFAVSLLGTNTNVTSSPNVVT